MLKSGFRILRVREKNIFKNGCGTWRKIYTNDEKTKSSYLPQDPYYLSMIESGFLIMLIRQHLPLDFGIYKDNVVVKMDCELIGGLMKDESRKATDAAIRILWATCTENSMTGICRRSIMEGLVV